MNPSILPKPEALSHVLYEIRMMVGCYDLIASKPSDPVIRNLALEGFLIHARCLRAFFTTGPKLEKPDDLLPSFFGFSSNLNLSGDDSYKRMHKEIAHLSHSRHDNPSEKLWNVSSELELLRQTCLSFLKEIEKHPENLEFGSNREQVSSLIGRLSPRSHTLYELDSTTARPVMMVMSSNPVGNPSKSKMPAPN